MAKNNKIAIVTLATPIEVEGGEALKKVELRKPVGRDLRQLDLQDILNSNIDTLNVLIPRISKITERQMINLEVENYVPLFAELVSFFVIVDEPLNE